MKIQGKQSTPACPVTLEAVRADVTAAYDDLVLFCETCASPFAVFERKLFVLMAVLGVRLIRLFLTAR